MQAARKQLIWKASGAAVLALATIAAFMAYLRPDMLVNFANAVMLCF